MQHKLNDTKRIYMLGIGGIGMSALARYFINIGVKVSGYDLTKTPLTEELELLNISIHYEEDIEQIDKDADLVIYSPAIPHQHKEFTFLRERDYTILKRSQVLGLITEQSKNICIAGTHGKTSISTLTAYLLREGGIGGTAFLGGISKNYDTNFWTISKDPCIIEADEYDRSFLQLSPDIAVISSADADHLDIYNDANTLEQSYQEFSNKIKSDGILFCHYDIPIRELFAPKIGKKYTYHLDNQSAFVHARHIILKDSGYEFDVHIGEQVIEKCYLPLGGKHNIENALVSIAIALQLGVRVEAVVSSLRKYAGVKRRFNIYDIHPNCILIDDYAHHPTELQNLIAGVRDMFPKHKLHLIFQPHLYSRTRDFAYEFASVLSKADETILLDIYPARELPIAGVTSSMLLSNMTVKNKHLVNKDELLTWIEKKEKQIPKVIVMAGAGNIDMLVQPMKKNIENIYL